MPVVFINNTRARFNDGTGKPLSQGTVGVYEAGTSFITLATVWDTVTKDVELTNPVILDDAGEAEIWYNVEVDLQIKDSSNAVVDTALGLDPNSGAASSSQGLLPNGSFEDDQANNGNPDNWIISAYSGSNIANISTSVSNGAVALAFNTGGAATGGGTAKSTKFPVTSLKLLDCLWSFYSSHASTTNSLVISWFKADGSASATPSTTLTLPAAGSVPTAWTNYREVVAIPSDATQGEVVITGVDSAGTNLTEKSYFDGISFDQTDAAMYSGFITAAGTSVTVPAAGIPEFTFSKSTNTYKITHNWNSVNYILQAQAPNEPDLTISTYLAASNDVTWIYKNTAGVAASPAGSHTFILIRYG